ncbi:MAG: hypothetical protein JOY69_03955, partial [Candidatus Eremiobacteraeota bacterium]|nr:hypothetical protein [Candidatus Eremiobacteraeota bacterium]
MSELLNLVVDLDERFALSPGDVRALCSSVPGADIVASEAANERMLAWIDFEFGGAW